jgi:hypothetical protein
LSVKRRKPPGFVTPMAALASRSFLRGTITDSLGKRRFAMDLRGNQFPRASFRSSASTGSPKT